MADKTGPSDVVLLPSFASSVPQCSENPPPVQTTITGFTKYWGCNHTVFITGPQGPIEAAAAKWNDAVQNAALTTKPPKLAYSSNPGAQIQVVVNGNGPWCGTTNGTPTTVPTLVNLVTKGGQDCPNNWSSSQTAVLVHEFAHVLGFTATHHNAGVTGVSNKCAIHLGTDSTINASVCQHEVEWLYSGYGIGPSTRPSDFWAKPIITGLYNPPDSITLAVNDSQQVSVTKLVFARSQQSSVNLGSVDLNWSTDNFTIASVPQAGLIRGESQGQTTVRARIGSGLPPTYQIGTIMAADGEPIGVTVTPAAGGFRVTAINGVTPPITTPGTRTLTATVVNQPGSTLQVRWEVDYSTSPLNPDTVTSWGPSTYALRVDSGSYNIRVKATPRSDGQLGTPLTVDYPVCTGGGGGGDFSQAAKPGDGTDAVGGC